MDEKKIVYAYTVERKTLRMVADEFETNHHRIKRILEKNGIEITQKDRIHKPFTEEHKRKISQSSKGRKSYWQGKKMPKETLYKNMAAHLKWNVPLDFLMQYEDIDRLKVLNRMLTRGRVSEHFNTASYMAFIEKFYDDKQFKSVYADYIGERKKKYAAPSLDHIVPLARGGTWELNNLQILSWVENHAKVDFMPDEWEYIKHKYFK